ncbi:hypothetical protein [Pedobacter sp. UYP1]|uniref:hypothetical protein n=1 Tax=Pedobacter sp. UYP1 TaxID=1756396 RepID=UPI0033935209
MKYKEKHFSIKIFAIIILIIGNTISCSAQRHQSNTNKNSKNMQIQNISNDFERLDVNELKAKAVKTTGIKVLPDKKTIEIEVYDYQKENENGDHIRISGDNYGDFRSEQRIKNAYFNQIKTYYQNGNIKSKGLEFNVFYGSFKKGIWYGFSPEGKLTSNIDYDIPFKFTFEQLVEFLKKENIPLKKGPIAQNPGYLTSVKRNAENGKEPFWQVSWLKASDKIEDIAINGLNGKVISRRVRNYVNN